MSTSSNQNTAYGLSQALLNVFPQPIVAQRAPTVNDKAKIGSVWINQPANAAYILTSIANNAANWENAGGGAGVFTSLTVQGTTNINTAGNALTNIGTGATAGAVAIGNAGSTTTVGGILVVASDIDSFGGNMTVQNGDLFFNTAGTGINLPGPTKIINGAGAPAGGLAAEVGDIYINTTAATAATRIYVATGVGAWTNVTCAA